MTLSMQKFNDFIDACEVRDLPLDNAQFTYSVDRQRLVSSRLD